MYENKDLLLLGGTGSFGLAFLEYVYSKNITFRSITVFSRDELKHFNLQKKYPKKDYPNLYSMIGDIRDKERLAEAMDGKEIVINAAAMKHVHLCEKNPTECWKTNVLGTHNLLDLQEFKRDLTQIVFISSDKAVNPNNVYGKSKKEAEGLYLDANSQSEDCKISVVRYGNVYGASGSIVPTLEEQKDGGVVTITDARMKRYFIQPEKAIEAVFYVLDHQEGGEIVVPQSEEISIESLAMKIAPNARIEYIGIREGEKLNEELMTEEEKNKAVKVHDYFVIR